MRRVLALPFAVLTLAAQPHLQNAQIQVHDGAALDQDFPGLVKAQSQAAWIGYAVPAAPGLGDICCFRWDSSGVCRGCFLDTKPPGAEIAAAPHPVRLEGPDTIHVLLRVERNRVQKILTLSADCELDGGGLPFHWFGNVPPSASLKLLASFISENTDLTREEQRRRSAALTAVALHREPAALDLLIRWVTGGKSRDLRRHAMSWIARSKDPRALRFIEQVLSR